MKNLDRVAWTSEMELIVATVRYRRRDFLMLINGPSMMLTLSDRPELKPIRVSATENTIVETLQDWAAHDVPDIEDVQVVLLLYVRLAGHLENRASMTNLCLHLHGIVYMPGVVGNTNDPASHELINTYVQRHVFGVN